MLTASPHESSRHTSTSSSYRYDAVLAAIYAAVQQLNYQLAEDQRLEQSPSTILFGGGASLDSLGMANFIVMAEEKLHDTFGRRIDLTQDDPFSPMTGHFRTLQSLANYVSDVLLLQRDTL